MLKPSSMCLSRTRRVRHLPRPAVTGLVLAALVVATPVAHALSLGRMNVMSALGEPLRAEIDVTSLSADQVASLQIGLASPEVYRAAGMEFSELLRGTRVTLARRGDGRQVLQVTSDRPARDPFVDLILQATWANGRLVREYTVLLDPPRRDVPARDEDRLVTSSGIDSDAESALPVAAAGAPVAQVPVAPAPTVRPPPAPQPSSPTSTALGRSSASASASAPASRAASPASTTPSAPASRVDTSAPPASGRSTSTRPTPPSMPDRTLSTAPAAPRTPAARQSDAETPAKAPARAAAAPRPGPATISGRYTVRSGDTLYRIARDARPETVSLDQMLVALYRSNPRAFTGDNMNRLLAGAVLTVPDAAEAARVAPEDARRVIQAHSSDMLAYRQKLAERAGLTGEGSATRASGRVEALVQDRRRPTVSSPDQLKLSQAAVAGRTNPEAALSDRAATQEAQRREAEIQRNVETLRQLEAESKTPAGPVPGGSGAGSPALAGTGAGKPEEGSASSGPQLATPAAAAAAAAAAAGPSAPDASALADPATPSAPPAADLAEAGRPMLAMYGLAAGGALGTLLLALVGVRLLRRKKQREGSAFLGEREAIEPSGDLPDVPELNAAPMSFDEAVAQRMAEAPDFDPDPMGEERHADPVAEADVYIAYGRLQQAEALLRAAVQAEPHRIDVQVKLLEVHAFQKDLAAFDAQAEILYEVTGGQGSEWTRALALRRALVAPPAAPSRVEPATVSRAVEDDVDLAFPPDPERTLASTLDAKELASMATSATQRPADAGASLPQRPLRPVVEPTLGPEPRSVEAADFSLDLDLPPSSRPPRPRQVIDLGDDLGQSGGPGVADPDAGDPLDRKLALAEEFIQIGDVEGARDLLGEVGAKGDGPLKERAQRLLRTLG